jgi:hypothetical protein
LLSLCVSLLLSQPSLWCNGWHACLEGLKCKIHVYFIKRVPGGQSWKMTIQGPFQPNLVKCQMVSKNIFKWILVKFEKKNPEDIYMYVKQLIMYIPTDRFHGVMVSVLISSVLDCRLMPLSGHATVRSNQRQ